MPKIIENIRENILENGKKMLLDGNYKDFNLRNLAKNCGLGLGTFYNYFSGKEELAYHIFKNDWDKTLKLVDDLIHHNISFKEKLFKIYVSLDTFLGQYMKIFREIAGENVKSCPHDYYKEIGQKMCSLVSAGIDNGSIKSEVDPAKLSHFIMVNMFDCVKTKYMIFEDLYNCMKL